jgi:hypothetical protein
LGELVDDPRKKRDCQNQVTRIQNERIGILHPIPCKQCGTFMRIVVPAGEGGPFTAVCPACHQAVIAPEGGKPLIETEPAASQHQARSSATAWLNGKLSLIFIIASNLLPIFGLLFLDWSMGSVMLLYWFENVIVGLFALLKMAFAQSQAGTATNTPLNISFLRTSFIPSRVGNSLNKLFVLPFFCIHFGLFCLGHGIFILALFLPKDLTSRQWLALLADLALPILGMLISHGTYFVQNYLRNGAYRVASINRLMMEPYARIVPMHVGLIAAGFFIAALGSPMPVVVALVLAKTGAEVTVSRNAMKKWASRTQQER